MLRGELEFIDNHDASDNNRLLTDLLLDRLVAPSSFHWPQQFHCFAGLDNDRQFLSSRNWLSLFLPITNQPFECSHRSLDPVAISDLLHGIDQSVWTRILLGVLAGSDPPQRLYETRRSKLEINHYFVDAYLSDCPTRFGRVDRSYRHCRRSISSSTQFSKTAAVTEGATEAKLPEDHPAHSFESCGGLYLEPIRGNFFKELTGPKSDANSTGSRQHLSGFFTTPWKLRLVIRTATKRDLRSFLFDFDSDFRACCDCWFRAVPPSFPPHHLLCILSTIPRICFASRLLARKIFLPRIRVRSDLCKLRPQ